MGRPNIPIVEILGLPIVGMTALGIILYTLVAGIRLPKNFPGVFAAVLIGSALYYTLAPMGLAGGTYTAPSPELHFGFPIPTLDFIKGFVPALKYLPIAIPFGLLTVIGGINVTESARVAGDDYNTREILLTEAVSTLVAGVCWGVAQSTPYIGQPAYKQMGSRAGYTLLTGLFIGLGGILGYVSFIVELIPRAVIAPILVFVAMDIVCQAFIATPERHAPAVAFALFRLWPGSFRLSFPIPISFRSTGSSSNSRRQEHDCPISSSLLRWATDSYSRRCYGARSSPS